MGTPFIALDNSNGKHREKLKMKQCAFPGCKVNEKMTGKACYCQEHRKKKYRKEIDEQKESSNKKKIKDNTNQTFKHKYTKSTDVVMKCDLECCNKDFTIRVIPFVYIYPKYCPEHRNEYKRKLFLQKHGLNDE